MILDTVFCSYLINEEEEAWEKATEVFEENSDISITPVILFELYYGAFLDENSELVRRVSNIARMYDMKSMNEDDIVEGAERLARADLEEGGESGVGQRDGMIGGVAANRGEEVLTENVDDFEKLNVSVEDFTLSSD